MVPEAREAPERAAQAVWRGVQAAPEEPVDRVALVPAEAPVEQVGLVERAV